VKDQKPSDADYRPEKHGNIFLKTTEHIMTNKTKWIIGTAVVLVALLLVIIFSKNIWNWFENVLIDIVIYLIVFAAGWLVGRFTGRKKQKNP